MKEASAVRRTEVGSSEKVRGGPHQRGPPRPPGEVAGGELEDRAVGAPWRSGEWPWPGQWRGDDPEAPVLDCLCAMADGSPGCGWSGTKATLSWLMVMHCRANFAVD